MNGVTLYLSGAVQGGAMCGLCVIKPVRACFFNREGSPPQAGSNRQAQGVPQVSLGS